MKKHSFAMLSTTYIHTALALTASKSRQSLEKSKLVWNGFMMEKYFLPQNHIKLNITLAYPLL